jgi:hypothetical protein
MNLAFIQEPELDFGAGQHIDIRFGIANYGPLDFGSPVAPKAIRLGIVGTPETLEGVQEWLSRCRGGIPAKPSKQPNLFTRFPGCSADVGFRTTVVMEPQLYRDLPKSEVVQIQQLTSRAERITRSVDLFLEAMGPGKSDEEGQPLPAVIGSPLDFHDLLKARAMPYRKPIQVILPSTYDEAKQRKQKSAGLGRTLQDEATRAWNLHSALYYKAGGVPWRLKRESTALTVCYVGISFYRSLDQSKLLTSVAQVFNERGEGVVVRGGTATLSKDDRQPHLSEADAHRLLEDAFARYREVHKTLPARIVLHKSSRFDVHERAGFEAAMAEERVEGHDFISMGSATSRLFRAGQYPPLRGTVLSLSDSELLLYTRGSVEFFETYPGKYVPIPLLLRCESTEQTHKFLAHETLSLTKMNWNNTQFDGAEPITLRAARQVSAVLRFCEEGVSIEPRYSFYM